jgi:hypothetical protein
MRAFLAAELVLATTGFSAVGQSQAVSDSGAAAQTDWGRTLGLLNERIEDVSLQEVPLDQAFDWVADFTALNVVVRWEVLADAGVERDKPITIEIHKLRLSQVLWLLLCEAGGTDVRLAYRVDPGLVTISSKQDLDGEMFIRAYDVSDLLLNTPRIDDRMPLDIARLGDSSSASLVSDRGGGEPERESAGGRAQHDRVDQLIELIQDAIEPDTWAPHGGLGTIRAWGSLIVVRNSIGVHQALGGQVWRCD